MFSVFDDFSSCWPKGVASPSLRLKYVTVGVTKHWTGSKGWHILYMGSGEIMINVSHPIGLYELQPGKWRPCEYSLCRCLKVKPKFKPRPVFRSYSIVSCNNLKGNMSRTWGGEHFNVHFPRLLWSVLEKVFIHLHICRYNIHYWIHQNATKKQ